MPGNEAINFMEKIGTEHAIDSLEKIGTRQTAGASTASGGIYEGGGEISAAVNPPGQATAEFYYEGICNDRKK